MLAGTGKPLPGVGVGVEKRSLQRESEGENLKEFMTFTILGKQEASLLLRIVGTGFERRKDALQLLTVEMGKFAGQR